MNILLRRKKNNNKSCDNCSNSSNNINNINSINSSNSSNSSSNNNNKSKSKTNNICKKKWNRKTKERMLPEIMIANPIQQKRTIHLKPQNMRPMKIKFKKNKNNNFLVRKN